MLSSILAQNQPEYSHHQSSPVQHPAWNSQTRAHQPHTGMASALATNPYTMSSSQASHGRPSQRLPSPPDSMEEAKDTKKCSLPGISNLLTGLHKDEATEPQQIGDPARRASNESLTYAHENNSRVRYPPTPPMRPGSGSGYHQDNQSPPSLTSTQSYTSSAPSFGSSSFNNLEPYAQRQMTYPPLTYKRPSVTSQGYSPYSNSGHGSPAASTGSYHMSPIDAPSPSSSLLYQRALPTNFPPTVPPYHHHQMLSSYPPVPTWQQQSHHHHFPPSSIPPYPQSPDRYICPQCNKAFSRPSSLKIHSHSHTGEKPFKCGHPNCGKAFSVRSNMKRHEKGCHGDGPGAGTMVGSLSPGRP